MSAALLILAALAVPATGKRIGNQAKLEVALDPFADAAPGMLTPGPNNGCTLQGWHGSYFAAGGAVKAFTVDIYPLTTTLTIESKQLKKNDAFNRTVGRFEGNHQNTELRDFFCSASTSAFSGACSFFAPGAVQALCAKEAATAMGTAVTDAATGAVDATKSFVHEASKDPLDGEFLKADPSNGCSLRGWSGKYYPGVGVSGVALQVDVYTYSTTFTFTNEDAWEKVFPQAKKLQGSHSNEELADLFCAGPGMAQAFPRACAFWSPGALGSLCPGLLAANAAKAATDTATAGYHAATKGYDAVKDYFGWK